MTCSDDTEKDCHAHGIFGGTYSVLSTLDKVTQYTVLFLFNYEQKLIHGTWQCNGPPRWDPSSKAFGGLFPAHLVRPPTPTRRTSRYLWMAGDAC